MATRLKELLKTLPLTVEPWIELGYFIGKITDLNVWNRSFSISEIEDFSKGCINSPNQSAFVNWAKPNITGLTEKVRTRQMRWTEICVFTEGEI